MLRTRALLLLLGLLTQLAISASSQTGATTSTETSVADGIANVIKNASPALTGVRRPPYRLNKSDVIEIDFTFSPEFNQTVTVQPDGYVALKSVGGVEAEGLTTNELQDLIIRAYGLVLHDPDVSVVLRDFEKPHFIAGGQVGRPGKYELRAGTSASEAVAIAGGFTEAAKHSQLILFRKVNDGVVESRVLNLKQMLASRNLQEDVELKPGDMLFVPQNRISKIKKFLPVASLSTFFTPAQF